MRQKWPVYRYIEWPALEFVGTLEADAELLPKTSDFTAFSLTTKDGRVSFKAFGQLYHVLGEEPERVWEILCEATLEQLCACRGFKPINSRPSPP